MCTHGAKVLLYISSMIRGYQESDPLYWGPFEWASDIDKGTYFITAR